MQTIEDIAKAIMADPENQEMMERGIKLLFAAPKNARLTLLVKRRAENRRQLYWKDKRVPG